jgi:hypothetical protein
MLAARRTALVEEWFAATLASYPAHTAQFLRREADRFRNPAGHALRESLAAVFDAVMLSDDWDRAERALNDLVQLRAVQDFTAAQAVGFIPSLKGIMRSVLVPQDVSPGRDGAGVGDQGSGVTLSQLDARVDRLMLLASDLHEKCRARMAGIRVNEAKRRTWLLDRVHRRQV